MFEDIRDTAISVVSRVFETMFFIFVEPPPMEEKREPTVGVAENLKGEPAEKTDSKAWPQYVNELTLLHEMLVTSMKCKQTTDLENIRKLRRLLDEFEKAYTHKEMSAAPETPHDH